MKYNFVLRSEKLEGNHPKLDLINENIEEFLSVFDSQEKIIYKDGVASAVYDINKKLISRFIDRVTVKPKKVITVVGI